MRSVMKIVTILAFLGSRGAAAQTMEAARPSTGSIAAAAEPLSLAQNTRAVHEAPVGHRQPHARDVPPQSRGEFERLSAEDAAVDRKLLICHGC